ncbi:fumarate reductase subunit C [Myxococcaceae bacterium]|nr:fumarate reductase subunit C [Myxococcaceae bacterium]
MSVPANPKAMAPHRPGRTRTAPPMRPDGFPSAPRYRTYLLFDATGLTYLLAGFAVLAVAWSLGSGPEAWARALETLRSPIAIAFHVLVLVSAIFVGVRFFRLFPKAQPARIGPAKPPPRPVIHAMLYVAWAGITLALVAVLGGFLP